MGGSGSGTSAEVVQCGGKGGGRAASIPGKAHRRICHTETEKVSGGCQPAGKQKKGSPPPHPFARLPLLTLSARAAAPLSASATRAARAPFARLPVGGHREGARGGVAGTFFQRHTFCGGGAAEGGGGWAHRGWGSASPTGTAACPAPSSDAAGEEGSQHGSKAKRDAVGRAGVTWQERESERARERAPRPRNTPSGGSGRGTPIIAMAVASASSTHKRLAKDASTTYTFDPCGGISN